MKPFVEKLRQRVPRGARVLCALSGGADSVAMTAALCALRDETDITIAAAHFHHGLRGADADGDLLFCERLCRELDIAFYAGRGNLSEKKTRGVEAAGRRARYDFLESVAAEHGMTHIATAHTADDNAETMLLNLVRGAGLDGLCGIPPVRGNIIRPMLDCSHEQALEFLEELGLSHREDASNHTDEYRRNRLRRNVMPLLAKENPAISGTLARSAALLRADADFLNGLACSELERLESGVSEYTCDALRAIKRKGGSVCVPAEKLSVLPVSLSGRVVRMMADRATGLNGLDLSQAHISSVLELCAASGETGAGGSLALPHDLTAQREYGLLRLFTGGDDGGFKPVALSYGQSAELPELGLVATWEKKPRNVNNLVYYFVLTSDTIDADLLLRPRQPGDRMKRNAGSRALQDIFVDAKIPRRDRARIPVVVGRHGIAGVYGIGAAGGSSPSGDDEGVALMFFRKGM